jgi:hypothetical protein
MDPPPDSPAATPPPDRSSPSTKPALALRLRQAHASLAPWVLAPLLLTACTGMAYRLLRDWVGLGRDQTHPLMVLHEGEWLRRWFGPGGESVYVLLNGLGLLWMLGSGAALLAQRLRRGKAGPGRKGNA